VDGTLLVVWAGRTRGEMLAQATERLLSLGVTPLGVVLNKISQRKGSYYYNTYYYYASRDGEEGEGGKTRRSRRRRASSQRQAEQAS